jgi:SPP1 gp7 family putative phage head morphogenesis protein
MKPSSKPPIFSPKKKLEQEYASNIGKILKRVLPPLRPKEQTLQEWLAAIAARSQQKDIWEASDWLARKMVAETEKQNYTTWREAAAKSSQSQKLYRLLQKEMQGQTGITVRKLITENAAYIRSIPLLQATKLTEEISRATQRGARPETINKMMRTRFPQLLRSRVKLIARTETAKASAALTKARCSELNIDWYVWLTSRDVRVRTSHKNMNGVLVPWSEAPSPEALVGEDSTLGHYHSGECPNCRCTQRVVLTLDDVQFPVRVYWHGKIQQMNKQEFKAIAGGLEERIAA